MFLKFYPKFTQQKEATIWNSLGRYTLISSKFALYHCYLFYIMFDEFQGPESVSGFYILLGYGY